MLHRLYGGVHLHDRKAATRGVEVTALDRAPTYVVLPMIMHVGEPCTPIVAVGDHVLLGQKIAQPTGLGAPIHASVSGTVTAIEPRPYADGVHVMSVVIENDFQDTPAPPLERKANPENLTCWEVVDLIAEAGIVGLGGMGHPTAAKLKDAIGKVDTLIINGTECEPYLTADHRLMLEDGERILGGAEILMHALNLNTALLGIDANKMNGIRALRSMLSEERGIQIVTLKTRYPQGADTQLVRKLTGRQVPAGKQPVDVNCAVFNIATVAAIYDAVVHGLPLTHRIITVSGGAVYEPRNLLVPIGTPLEHLLEECGGLHKQPDRVLLGGPMTGKALHSLESSLLKSTRSLLFLTSKECSTLPAKSAPCIRCGRCIKVCPMNLTPLYFNLYVQSGKARELERFRIADCMECGCCTYACPSHINLMQSIRTAKNQICHQQQTEKMCRAEPEEIRVPQAGEEDSQ